jgi:hypothetical protein
MGGSMRLWSMQAWFVSAKGARVHHQLRRMLDLRRAQLCGREAVELGAHVGKTA